MVEPVIAIGVGFFIIMCIMVKFTGINNISDMPDIVDDTYDDIQNTLKQDVKYKSLQDFDDIDDVSINCIDINIDTDIINHDLTFNNNDETSDDDIQQLMHLLEPIEDNIKQVSVSETFRILNFSAKHEKEIDLSGTTLISLRSIKQ